MPRLTAVPNRIYSETDRISKDVSEFSGGVSYNLTDITDVEELEVKRIQGNKDSSISLTMFLESDRVNISDNDYGLGFIVGSDPNPAILFRGVVEEARDVTRGNDADVRVSLEVQQGSGPGFVGGSWLFVERSKVSNNIVYNAGNSVSIAEYWISHTVSAVLGDTGGGTDNMLTLNVASLASGTRVGIFYRLT